MALDRISSVVGRTALRKGYLATQGEPMNLLPKTLAGIAGISVTIWCGWTSWVLFVGGTLPVVGETVSGNPVRGLMFFIVVEPVVGAVAVFGTFFLVHLLQAPLTLAIALIRELRREVTPFERQQHELIRVPRQGVGRFSVV